MFQAVGIDYVDMDNAYLAELECMEEGENAGILTNGQFNADIR